MKWIDRQDEFVPIVDRLAKQPQIAVDTEADSLHSYYDKVCLVQISTGDEDFVVDPLARIDLAPFGKLLADPDITKILHGGDYDLRILNRDFGFVVRNLIDTSVCAQLLGYEAIGLAALLDRHFGVKANKAHQRADWAMRPLPTDMLAYATMDTHYLIPLAEKLKQELIALGRWEWALEEFARLETVRHRESEEDVETWRRIKTIGGLDRRGLAVVREVHAWREGVAQRLDRPPFKVFGNEAIVTLAKTKPKNVRELAQTAGVARYHVDKYGRDIVAAVGRAVALPEDQLPEKNEPKPWIRDKALEARIERLKKVRDRFAKELTIDPSIVAPRHILAAVATSGNLEVPAMREWQRRLLGDALLGALEPEKKLF